MIIKDRLIEVDLEEALTIAGKGEKVRCVGEGTGLMDIAGALEGLTFFAPESALTEKPEPIKLEVSKDEIAKLAKSAPIAMRYDTPEARTRAIIGSVERYDEEHGDPPITRQDTEDAPKQKAPKAEVPKKAEAPKAEAKAEALAKEYSGEVPGFVPFASAPSGGALKK